MNFAFVWTSCRFGLSVAGRLAGVHSLCVCVWLWYFSVLTVNLYFWEKELMPLRYGTPFSFILSPPIPLARSLVRSIFFIFCLSNWSIFLSALRLYLIAVIHTNAHTHTQPASQPGSPTKSKRAENKMLNQHEIVHWDGSTQHRAHSIWISKQRQQYWYCTQCSLHSSAHEHTVFLFNCFNMFNFTICANLITNCVYDFIHHLICLFRFCAFLWNNKNSVWFAKVHFEWEIFYSFSVGAGSSGV